MIALEDALRKMSSLAAEHVGIADRGRIAPGMYADLVLFDPATVTDLATPAEPHALSRGVIGVWVNGRRVFDRGRPTGARPGRVLRRT